MTGERFIHEHPLGCLALERSWWLVRDDAWTSANPPALPTPPLAVVPPAELPTVDEADSEISEAR
jgi:hypothetical protein